LDLPYLKKIEDIDFNGINLVFCALPHSTSQKVIKELPKNVKIIDLSADFRLRDPDDYEKWYGVKHNALELQNEAVYGLTEFYREQIVKARLVACTGCNSASALLLLLPLIKKQLINPSEIIINLATGVSGAGRAAKESMLHSEVSEGFVAYNVSRHRHLAEFDQELSYAAGKKIEVTFTPHLLPQNRGILATIYVHGEASEIQHELEHFYSSEPFITILPAGMIPSTRHVRGSNYCHIGVVPDRISGKTILFSAIDNLTKGSSGQAVQNANLMFGLSETLGLEINPLFP
jgi:N-acetyl-gamma-glutamyl-phosphate reductase